MSTPAVVVGCGGCGCTTVERLAAVMDVDSFTINANSPSKAPDVLLTPEELQSCMGDPVLGWMLSSDRSGEISGRLSGHDSVIITAGLGGGTGTGVLPVVAECASSIGIPSVAVVNMPMTYSSDRRLRAEKGLAHIMDSADWTIVIDSSRITDEGEGNLKYDSIVRAVDELTCKVILSMAYMIRGPLRSLMPEKAYTVGISGGADPVEATFNALKDPMLAGSLGNQKAVVHLNGAITLSEREEIINQATLLTGVVPEVVSESIHRDIVNVLVFSPISVRRVCR